MKIFYKLSSHKNICTFFYVTIYHMTVTCIFLRKCNTLLYNGSIKLSNKQIGSCNFLIDNKNLIINNLEINEGYRRRGFGSHALNKIEKYSKDFYDIKKVNLTAWDINGSTSNFFKYNNYKNISTNNLIYDDYVRIYDLIKFEKSLD